MTTFRWLHLSDFHLGMSRYADFWPNMEAAFFDDLDTVLKDNDLDLVLFTGDLVQTGNLLEYQQLDKWLQKLWDKFSKLKLAPRLLAVPGNHDLVRPPEGASAAIALRYSWNQEEVQKEFWKNPNSEYRKLVDHAFDNYSAWQQNTAIPKPERITRGLLPGDFSASINKDQYSLAVIGLNTAFRHLGDKNTEKKSEFGYSATQCGV
jgi:3',5'-cyclic AMP phosphodiesterase CpdA